MLCTVIEIILFLSEIGFVSLILPTINTDTSFLVLDKSNQHWFDFSFDWFDSEKISLCCIEFIAFVQLLQDVSIEYPKKLS